MSRRVRVLHLIDPASPGGGACTLRLLAEPLNRLPSIEQDVIVIGHEAHEGLARRCGVTPAGVITPPLGAAPMSYRAVRRAVREMESIHGRFDVVHGWTEASSVLGRLALPRRHHVGLFTVGPVAGSTARALIAGVNRWREPIYVTTPGVAREYGALGLDPRRIETLAPAVDPEATVTDRHAIRERWGVTDETFVIGALAQPADWTDARRLADILARMVLSGRDIAIVLHHSASRRVDTERWVRRLGLHDRFIIDDEVSEPWRIVRGLDAALSLGSGVTIARPTGIALPGVALRHGRSTRPTPGVLPLLWAMAANVPVVASDGPGVAGVVEEGVTGLLIEPGDVNRASDRLISMYDDRTIAARLATSARAAVNEDFNVSALCVRLKAIYERAASRPPAEAHDGAHDERTNGVPVYVLDDASVAAP